jgi:hypothetical protein
VAAAVMKSPKAFAVGAFGLYWLGNDVFLPATA